MSVFEVTMSAALPVIIFGIGALYENSKRKKEIASLHVSLDETVEALEIERARVDNIREWIARRAPISEKT